MKSIKHWDSADQPREKLETHGAQVLSNAELLAILIGSGTREQSAVQLCQEILQTHNHDLNVMSRLTIADLTKYKGIGHAKAITIMAAMELTRRRQQSEIEENPIVNFSAKAVQILRPHLSDLHHEEFWVLLLNKRLQLQKKQRISSGGLSATVADVRMILKLAISENAHSLILAHNHPSGSLEPSKADLDLTKKVKESAALMDIQLQDHVIITTKGFYSFADNGKI